MSVVERLPGVRALRFARMAGSSIAGPDAAGWLTDFLNAGYFARPGARRPPPADDTPPVRDGPPVGGVDDLRLAYAIVTTQWHQLGRRLRAHDVIAFHRAFGPDRFLRSPRLTLTREQLLAGAVRLHGDWFPEAYAHRRAYGVCFATDEALARFDPSRRLRDAALGPLTPPRAAGREWSTYAPVRLPSVEQAVAALSAPARWPDFGCALGRFTALRPGGLEGQTFEIEVVAHPVPRTPVFTRAYVSVTGLHTDPSGIEPVLERAAAGLGEPALPDGAAARLLLELTTHEGHFLGAAVSRLVIYEHEGAAFIRAVGEWDPLPAHLAVPFRVAGREAQHRFWGEGDPDESMLAQLALAAQGATSAWSNRPGGDSPGSTLGES